MSELSELALRWRNERTSDLADTIDFVDRAARPKLPLAPRLDELGGMQRWLSTLAVDALGPWLDELCAHASSSLEAAAWVDIANATRALASLPPDPRLGRAIERMLQSSSNHWFRVDQVGHAIERFEKPHDEPSFADHALPLLVRNADRGTAARLEKLAETLHVEADCNGAEMASRVGELAARLAKRSHGDRLLDENEIARLRSLDVRSPSDEKRRVLGSIEPHVVLDRTNVDRDSWSVVLRSNARLVGPHLVHEALAPEWRNVRRLHANDGHLGFVITLLENVRIFEDLSADDLVDLFETKPTIEGVGGWLDGAFCETSRTLAALRDAPKTLSRVRVVAGASWRPKMWTPAKWLELWPFADHVTRFETWSDDVEGWRSILDRLPASIQTVVLDPKPRASLTEDDVVVLERVRFAR